MMLNTVLSTNEDEEGDEADVVSKDPEVQDDHDRICPNGLSDMFEAPAYFTKSGVNKNNHDTMLENIPCLQKNGQCYQPCSNQKPS